ncbi:MAG: CehA/McbA family metallohydrolase [Deltaproteobacteria bacterium]|nr:CehA/McbA family metallohydrolase [Deltaproteobacteria bacterium]
MVSAFERLRATSRGFLVSLGLLAIGAAGGVAFDDAPARPRVTRGEYRVLEADFHAHTAWSDGTLSPFGVVRQAARRGLDVIAITEHNTVLPSQAARLYARATGGPLVVTGEEITSSKFHLIALGIHTTVTPKGDAQRAIDEVHAQGGVAIAAHPVRRFWPSLLPAREALDGAEAMHPIAFGGTAGGWKWSEMIAFRDEATKPLTAIGSSDYHAGSVLGICRTLVFVHEPADEAAVLDALRAGRTVTFDAEGHPIGSPALIQELAREPYTPRTSDYEYRGVGMADRVLRSIGLVGLVGVLFLSARRRR